MQKLSHSLWILAGLSLSACGGDIHPEVLIENTDRPGIGTLKPVGGKADEACGPFGNDYYQFLDDTRCARRLPTNRSRDLVCPNRSAESTVELFDGTTVVYQPASESPEFDAEALVGVVPDDMRITLVLVRRVNGVPHYRYLSNGRHHETFQPWSTTKFMAIAQAGARLRQLSNGEIGLTAKAGDWEIGDLISMVHNYDERFYSSNGLARWFLNIGGRGQLNDLIHHWLQRPGSESLGGNYGRPTADVSYEFRADGVEFSMEGEDGNGPRNHLSTFTLAEALKRVVNTREDPQFAWPGLNWPDVQALLYGAENSNVYTVDDAQGMESDTAIYLQQFDVDAMERRSQGQWRTFGKLGFGHRRRSAEFVHSGYACLPALNEDGEPIPEVGKEFFIATQYGTQGPFADGDARLAAVYRELTEKILSGVIK